MRGRPAHAAVGGSSPPHPHQPGAPPPDPADWIEYGLDQFDDIVRIGLNTGDGGYAEGPFYWRFTSQNLVPFARAWDRLLGGAAPSARP